MKLILKLAIVVMPLWGNLVSAATLLDTGSSTISSDWYGNFDGPTWELSSSQFLAGQFSFAEDVTITGMEGLIGFTNGGYFQMELYQGQTSLFNSNVLMGSTGTTEWAGVSGMNLSLSANTDYSLVFRGLNGFVSKFAANATDSLAMEWYVQPYNGNQWELYNLDLGIRVLGDVSAVPVPAAVWLFGSGLLGLFGFMRKTSR